MLWIIVLAMLDLMLFASPTLAYQETDFKCLHQCSANGGMYDFCLSRCSYETNPPRRKNVDFNCLSECSKRHFMYDYCQQVCSY